MAINNPYIPGDPFSYDLKWLVRKVKTLLEFNENFDEKVEEAVGQYITNLDLPTDYINVTVPGHGLTAVKGDGVTDDTDAFKAIIAYCIDNKKPLYVPQFCNILITDDVKMIDMPNLIIQGTISGDPALEVQISYDAQTTDAITWDFGTIDGPVLKMMGAKNAMIRVQKASELELYADGSQNKYYSFAYNTLLLGNISKLEFTSVSGGWINENVFLGGRFSTFVMDGDYSHNNNIFYRPTFETVSFDIVRGNNNYFYDVRLEGTNTIHFHELATGNVMTRTWLSSTPTVSLIETPYTDDNGTNIVIISTSAYNNYNVLEIDRKTVGYDVRHLSKTATGMKANGTYGQICETGLVPVEKGAVVQLTSDGNLWRLTVEIYDQFGNKITTQPSTTPLYLGAMAWDANSGAYYYSGAAGDLKIGCCRYKYGVDTGVAYAKFIVSNPNATGNFTYLNVLCVTSKEVYGPAKFKMMYDKNVKATIPTTAGDVGDIVYKSNPATGQPIGWICTATGDPGTWVALPNL